MAGGNIPGNLRGIFVAAGQQFHIPPSVLAGVASVETNLGQNRGPSSTGALGLMQFEPGTARSIGINPNNDRQAIFGAAKLLTQYGYHQDPLRAIGAYNGGPGNPQMGYANQVMSEASRLRAELGGGAAVSQSQPQPQGLGQMPSMSVTTPTFNRQGFDQAQRRYLTGTFLSQTAQNNPWGTTGGSAGLAPLFAAGALTTTPPNMADFQGSKTFKVAQQSLQGMAGSTPLKVHPIAAGSARPRIPYLGTTLAPIGTMVKYFGPQASGARQTTVDFAGHPVQVNRVLAANVHALGQAIQRAGLAGQIKDIGGFRTSIGASGAPIPYSMHQFGTAIDVNEGSQNWHTLSMDPRMVALFKQFGWFWGGNWGGASRDPGHFQFMGGL